MARIWGAAILLLLGAGPVQADLTLRNIHSSHGVPGPERKSADYYPADEVFYRYTIPGLKTDAQGDIDIVIESRIVDAKGKVIPGSRDPIKGKLNLAGGCFTGSSV